MYTDEVIGVAKKPAVVVSDAATHTCNCVYVLCVCIPPSGHTRRAYYMLYNIIMACEHYCSCKFQNAFVPHSSKKSSTETDLPYSNPCRATKRGYVP